MLHIKLLYVKVVIMYLHFICEHDFTHPVDN